MLWGTTATQLQKIIDYLANSVLVHTTKLEHLAHVQVSETHGRLTMRQARDNQITKKIATPTCAPCEQT